MADTYTCKLNFVSGAGTPQIAGGDIAVSGVLQNAQGVGVAGKVRLSLIPSSCTFQASALPLLDVMVGSDGVIPPQYFTSADIVNGQVTGEPIDPAGEPDSKAFAFVSPSSQTLGVAALPAIQVGDGDRAISARATVMRGQVPQEGVDVSFTLLGTKTAQFRKSDGSMVAAITGTTGPDGACSVDIVDKVTTSDRGQVAAAIINQSSAPAARTANITFTSPGDVSAVLMATQGAVFEPVTGSFQVTALVMAAVKESGPVPVVGATVTFQISDFGRAYFTSPTGDTRVAQAVRTDDNGQATVTVTSSTWGDGMILASVDCSASTNYPDATPADPDSLSFLALVPEGLGIISGEIAFAVTDIHPDAPLPWRDYTDGAPATTFGVVRVNARYVLNGEAWRGYGPMTFALDKDRGGHALIGSGVSSSLLKTDPVTVMYNPCVGNSVKPAGPQPTDACVYVRDGIMEDIVINAIVHPIPTDNPGKDVPPFAIDLTFGQAWANVTDIHITCVGQAAYSPAWIYRNSLHQARIRIDLRLTDEGHNVLTANNGPSIDAVAACLRLMDATTDANNEYTSTGQMNKNSTFRSVNVTTTANIFRKQLSQPAGSLALTQYDEGDDSGITNGVATLYYYIAFQDMDRPPFNSTTVGLKITPPYAYGDANTIRFVTNPFDDDTEIAAIPTTNTIVITALEPLQYGADNVSVTPTLQNAGVNHSDDAPGNSIDNYSRIWNFDLTLQGGGPLFGAFIADEDAPRAYYPGRSLDPEQLVIADVKSGFYQTKAYLWPDNIYEVSRNQLDADDLGGAIASPAPAGRAVMLAGLPANQTGAPALYTLRMTVACGFGDLTTWRTMRKVLNLKLVDIYGNSGALKITTAGLPTPDVLVDNAANWAPLLGGEDGGASSDATLSASNFTFARAASLDDSGENYNNSSANLAWGSVSSSAYNYAGGYPATFASGQAFAASNPDGDDNQSKYYRLSATIDGKTAYNCAFKSKVTSKENEHLVIGTTDPGLADYVQFKPYWKTARALIYARPDATGAATMYWRWTGNTDTDGGMPSIMIFAGQYDAKNISGQALWDVKPNA